MKKIVLLAACLFISAIVLAQAPQLTWVKKMGGASATAISNNMRLDPSGNIYTVGSFSGTVDFDPGAGTLNLSSLGSNDIFVTKQDASGNLIWAKAMGGTSDEAGYAIALDASSNVYVTGNFSGTTDFDPGAGVSNLTSAGSSDVFITQLDQNGNFLWAKKIGGSSPEYGNAIDVKSNSIVVCGNYSGTTDFDPNAGVFNLTSAGGDDIFVLRLDLSGNLIWAKSFGGSGSEWGDSVGFDGNYNIYSTGNFAGTADFDPSAGIANLITVSGSCSYISKLDSSGNHIWAKSFNGPGTSFPNGMTIDASGNVYTIGNFSGMVDFNPGAPADTVSAIGGGDIYISKLDASGNSILSKTFGGPGSHFGGDVTVDASGNMYLVGNITGTVDFDPGIGTFNLTTAGGNDAFLVKLNSTGNFMWASKFGSTGSDNISASAVNTSGSFFATGKFAGTVDFDPSAGTNNVAASGTTDMFVLKISECSPVTITASDTTICAGSTATLTAAGATTYLWNTAETTPSIVISPVANTTYTVTGSMPNGCSSVVTKSVSIIAITPITITVPDTSICAGSTATLTASGAITYLWNTGATTSSILVSPMATTNYTVTGTLPNGCSSVATKSILVISSKTLSGNVTGLSNGNMILFKYSSSLGKWDSVAFTPYTSSYNFGPVESALYVIKAVPTATNEQATYGTSAISWQDADVITHGCAVNSNQNLSVIALANIGVGTGSFTGKIFKGNGYGMRTNGVNAPGNPIGGIIVKGGRNPGGQMFVQTTTAADGTYTLSGMPNSGTSDYYFILVDIAGLDTNGTYHKKISTINNIYTGLDFTIDSIYVNPQTFISVNDLSAKEHSIKVFPNPAINKVNIQYSLTADSNVEIELFDIFGKTIKTILMKTEQSIDQHCYSLDVNEFSSGMYFLKININGAESTIKLFVTD